MYQVLYRKWRPQTFSDVYGQDTITTALRNELRTGRLAHAYLFTGSRGTGKTTCAKIMAKAVNCLHPVDGDPCNACEVCRGIDDGTVLDVVEIDAASNNGVDNIRDLREEVNFTPAVAKYRVYIIDEVHMLSIGAFNALLKTLEEPPEHVIFILATTEVHKLPATILSRCQRFDFGRVAPEAIAARLRYVAEQEGFSLSDGAAELLARLADGGMRDALSLLDQCLSRSQEITEEVVAAVTGLAGRDHLFELSAAIRTGNGGEALAIIDRLHNASRDMERVCTELIDFFRNLMILKSIPNGDDLVIVSESERARLREEADAYALPVILHAMETLQKTLERLRGGGSRRVELETALLRLCTPALDTSVEALLRRVQALEDALRSGAVVQQPTPAISPAPADVPKPAPLSPAPPTAPAPKPTPLVPETPPAAKPAASNEPTLPFDRWGDVLAVLSTSCRPLYGVLQESTAFLRGDFVLISTNNEMFRVLVSQPEHRKQLAAAVRSVTGREYRIGLKKSSSAPTAAPPADPLSDFLRQSQQMGVNVEIDN